MSENQSARVRSPRRSDGVEKLKSFTVSPPPHSELSKLLDAMLPKDVSIEVIPNSLKALRELKQKRFLFFRNPPGSRLPAASSAEVGPRGRAMLRGVAVAEKDLQDSEGAFSLENVRHILNGISRQAIDRRVKEGSLLAVPGLHNRRMYPVIQFTDDRSVVVGLRQVTEALPTKNPWTVLNFLVNSDDRLGGQRPIDVMKTGKVDLVIESAKLFGQAGS